MWIRGRGFAHHWKALSLIPSTNKTQNKTLKEIRGTQALCVSHLGIHSAICATHLLALAASGIAPGSSGDYTKDAATPRRGENGRLSDISQATSGSEVCQSVCLKSVYRPGGGDL